MYRRSYSGRAAGRGVVINLTTSCTGCHLITRSPQSPTWPACCPLQRVKRSGAVKHTAVEITAPCSFRPPPTPAHTLVLLPKVTDSRIPLLSRNITSMFILHHLVTTEECVRSVVLNIAETGDYRYIVCIKQEKIKNKHANTEVHQPRSRVARIFSKALILRGLHQMQNHSSDYHTKCQALQHRTLTRLNPTGRKQIKAFRTLLLVFSLQA